MSATLPVLWWRRRRWRKPPPAHGVQTAPTLVSINPTTGVHGTGFTLTVTGTNFNSQTSIWFNGVTKTTTYLSPKQMRITLVAADTPSAASYSVQVKSTNGQNSSSINYVAT